MPDTKTLPETVAGTRRLTISEALREAIAEEMRRDPDVFLIGEDIGVEGGFGGAFGVYLGLVEEFGHDRMIDTPISEKAIAGAAVGAEAAAGLAALTDFGANAVPSTQPSCSALRQPAAKSPLM